MTYNFEIVCNNSSVFIWYSLSAGTEDKDPDRDIICARAYSPEANAFALAENRTEWCHRYLAMVSKIFWYVLYIYYT